MMIKNMIKLEDMKLDKEMMAELFAKNPAFKMKVETVVFESEADFLRNAYFDNLEGCNWEFDIYSGWLDVRIYDIFKVIGSLENQEDYFTIPQRTIFDKIEKLYSRWYRLPSCSKADDLLEEKMENLIYKFFDTIRDEIIETSNDGDNIICQALDIIECGYFPNLYINDNMEIFELTRL